MSRSCTRESARSRAVATAAGSGPECRRVHRGAARVAGLVRTDLPAAREQSRRARRHPSGNTVATTLGRVTLPRERFVEPFARACGLGEEEIHQWLLARRRIAAGESAPTRDEGVGEAGDERDNLVGGASAPAHAPRWRRALVMTAAADIGAVGALGVVGVVGLVHDASSPAGPPAMPVTGLRMPAVGSWAQIHPARTPELCVTEGSDRTGRYKSAVAAQQPCTRARLTQVCGPARRPGPEVRGGAARTARGGDPRRAAGRRRRGTGGTGGTGAVPFAGG